MRDVVSIHIGGAGIALGGRMWEALYDQHAISPSGQTSALSAAGDSFFLKAGTTRFVPRAVLVDSRTDDANAFRASSHGGLIKPDNVVVSNTGFGSGFARGYLKGKTLRDQAVTRANTMLGASSDDPILLVTHSLAGATGGGLGAAIVERLRAVHPTATIVCASVLGDASDRANAVQPYNEVLALNAIRTKADLVVVLDNAMLKNAAKSAFGVSSSAGFTNENRVIGRALAGLTAPARVPLTSRMELRELARALTPKAGLNLAGLSIVGRKASSDIVTNVLSASNRIGGYRPSDGKSLSPVFIVPKSTSVSPTDLRSDPRLRIAPWFPLAPLVVRTRSVNPSVVLAESHTGIRKRLTGIVGEFDALIKRNAFTHLYTGEGLTKSQMTAARRGLADLALAYQRAA